jgi:hypothetical protein
MCRRPSPAGVSRLLMDKPALSKPNAVALLEDAEDGKSRILCATLPHERSGFAGCGRREVPIYMST